jgi:hypothetical protein
MIVYHSTTQSAASEILRSGFKESGSAYLTDRQRRGVWVSDVPLDLHEGLGSNDAVLQIVLDIPLAEYEWIEEGKPYREWLIPAAILNEYGTIRAVNPDDDDHWAT